MKLFHIHKYKTIDRRGQLVNICSCGKECIIFCNICQSYCKYPRTEIKKCPCCNLFVHIIYDLDSSLMFSKGEAVNET